MVTGGNQTCVESLVDFAGLENGREGSRRYPYVELTDYYASKLSKVQVVNRDPSVTNGSLSPESSAEANTKVCMLAHLAIHSGYKLDQSMMVVRRAHRGYKLYMPDLSHAGMERSFWPDWRV